MLRRSNRSRLVPSPHLLFGFSRAAPILGPTLLGPHRHNFTCSLIRFARAANVDEAIEAASKLKAAERYHEEVQSTANNSNCSSSSSLNAQPPTFTTTTTTTSSASASVNSQPLWPNCDTIEEILEEEKFGPEGEEEKQPPVQPEHVVLAFRAFVWGTFWAFVGVGSISLIAMKLGGFASVKEVLQFVGEKDRRRIEEMKAQGVEVIEYAVDLTNPSSVPDQLSQVWNHILTASGAAQELAMAMEQAAAEGAGNIQSADGDKAVA